MESPIFLYVKEKFLNDKNAPLDFILHSGRKREDGSLTIIFFSRKKPIVVAKISRENEEKLKREYQNLKTIHAILKSPFLKEKIEKPLSLLNLGFWVLFKSYKKGILGSKYILKGKRNLKKFLDLSSNWLIEFLKETKDYHINSKEEKEKAIKKISKDLSLRYLKYWIKNDSFFLAPCHGDLTSHNFFLNNSEISGIIDFEDFSIKGFPEGELLGIITSTALVIFGISEKAILKTFFEENFFSRKVNEILKKYCNAFKINPLDFLEIMPIYSERAIFLAKKFGDENLLNFHKKLKEKLIEDKDKLLFNRDHRKISK